MGLSRRIVQVGLCCGAVVVMSAPGNAADQRLVVDVSTAVSAATNPFLAAGPDTSAMSAYISVRPEYRVTTDISSLVVRGHARLEQYSRRYDRDEAGELAVQYLRRTSERASLRGGVVLRTNRSSTRDILGARVPETEVTPILVVPSTDVTYIGRRLRTVSGSANVGASISVGDRSTLDGDAVFGFVTFQDPALFDYWNAQQQLGYAHRLTGRTHLKVTFGVSTTDYRRTVIGDAVVVSPLAGIETALTERLSISLQAGASVSWVRQPSGLRDRSTGIALRGSLCDRKDSNSACVRIDRSVQPTAVGGVATALSVGAALTRQISPRDTLSLDASYSRTSESGRIAGNPSFVAAGAELSREVGGRLSVFGGAHYADVFNSGPDRRANFQVRAGLRCQIGARK